MKVKDLKEYLNMYKDDIEIVVKVPSGMQWDFDNILLTNHILKDDKREVFKLYIK